MHVLFNCHDTFCTPLQPCKKCQAAEFLRTRLSADDWKVFMSFFVPEEILDKPWREVFTREELGLTVCGGLTKAHLVSVRDILDATPNPPYGWAELPHVGQKGVARLANAFAKRGILLPV